MEGFFIYMEKKLKILAIGEVVVDETIVLSDQLINGWKIKSKGFYYSVGGPAAVASFFYQKLGYQVTFVSSLAKDKDGYWIMEKFRKRKINLVINFQSKTQKNIILVDEKNKKRTIIKDCLSSKPIKNFDKKLIQEADLIYLDRHQSHLFDLLLTYKKKETEIIFDPSTDVSLKNLMILKQVNFPIVPYEFVFNFGKKESIKNSFKKIVNFLKKPLIVTLGEWGSLFLKNDQCDYFSSYSIKAVDVSGAGDIFRAAFGEALINNFTLLEAINYANKVAALMCLRVGTSEAIPSRKEIKKTSLKKNHYQLSDFFKSFSFKKYDQSSAENHRWTLFGR